MKAVKKYLLFISILLLIITFVISSPISNLDELWNFSMGKNIANGLLPYKDFNLIIMPLYPFVNGLILAVFGKTLLTFRISYILIIFLINVMIYKVFKKLNIKFSYILMTIITFLLLRYGYNDYNLFQVLLTLLIIYLELKENKNNLLIGLLCGIAIINKQTTGLILSIIALISPIILEKFNFKQTIERIMGMLIFILTFTLYVTYNNLWPDFIDQTVLGIFTFSNKLLVTKTIPVLILVFIFVIYSILTKKEDKNKKLLLMYAIGSLVVIYPICDYIHLLLGLIPLTILVFYYLKDIKLSFKSLIYIVIIINLVFSVKYLKSYITSPKINNYQVYNNLILENDKKEDLDIITTYLKENDNTYILDFTASKYMLAINRYNKYYDLFMNGNFGKKGEEEIIEQLGQENFKLLINDNFKHYQRPTKILEYVHNNYHMTGTIGKFNIYEK